MIIKWQCRFLLILWITFGFKATSGKWSSEKEIADFNDAYKSKYKVDYFVLATEWPQGICEYINATHRHECVVSYRVGGWVLHGLWPSIYGHKFLQYCNSSLKFDFNKVKDMQDDLMKYWPNLFKDSTKLYLWKHEYEKHGTCAALVKGFETEREYFRRAMELLQKYDPKQILRKKGIVPSRNAYESETIIAAINSGYGKNACTQCSHYSDSGVEVLSGVEICLTKQLKLMHCPRCGSKYACRGEVYYHPLHFKV